MKITISFTAQDIIEFASAKLAEKSVVLPSTADALVRTFNTDEGTTSTFKGTTEVEEVEFTC